MDADRFGHGLLRQATLLAYLPPPDDPDPTPYDAATGVSISAPTTMAPGATAYVTVTIRNSGTTTWYPGVTYPYRLGAQNPQDNLTWGVGRVELGSTVAPSGQAVFGFIVTAPTTPGTYAFGWGMLREGLYWFGGNISSTITVAAPAPVYDAQLVSASVPTTMTAGSYYNVSMTFRNAGNTTWTSPDFALATPDDNYTWGMNRIAMSPSTVGPGQNATFSVLVRAPSTASTYVFQWGMVWEYHQRFGPYSTTYVTVSAPTTPKPTISPSHTAMTAGQSFTMSWSTANATSLTHVCSASGPGYTVNESLALSGSQTMTAQAGWVNYPSTCTWTASGPGGTTTYVETMTTIPGANSAVTYIHTDGLGSPVARTNASGAVISRTRYEPYGYVASGAQPTIGFTGHVNDVDTGLTYMQQRYYDPVAGRFLSIDPVVTDASTGGSFNRYAYANNNPYRFIDPDGRSSCADKDCKTSTIDSRIMRADGETTKITFINDDPKGASPNQPVATNTANLIEAVISGANVDSVNINSTTGGIHGATSNHGSGRAVDMDQVDGKPVSAKNEGAGKIQEAARQLKNTRENFGPNIMEKNVSTKDAKPTAFGDKTLTNAHKTHVHISVQP